MKLFSYISNYCYSWLKKWEYVKEESITDYLLYNISQFKYIKTKAFSRHEEAINGSDWEWWIITDTSDNYNAYRFLVQAKKLKPEDQDNYSLIAYSNRSGMQIELLINSAKKRKAMPLYAFYSTCKHPNYRYFEREDGCFLSSAFQIYNGFICKSKKKILDYYLLKHSIPLSEFDYIFNKL